MESSDQLYQPPWSALVTLVLGALVQIHLVFMIEGPWLKFSASLVLLLAAYGFHRTCRSVDAENPDSVETESSVRYRSLSDD